MANSTKKNRSTLASRAHAARWAERAAEYKRTHNLRRCGQLPAPVRPLKLHFPMGYLAVGSP
jgi:hypothetical protein